MKNPLSTYGVTEVTHSELMSIEGGRSFWGNIGYNLRIIWNNTVDAVSDGLSAWSEAFNEGAKAGGPLIH